MHLRKVNSLISMRICTCWSMHLLSHLLSRFNCPVWRQVVSLYKLNWMFKTKMRIRLYTCTVWCLSESSQYMVSGHYTPPPPQRNVICMSLRWQADGGLVLDVKREEPMSSQDSDQTVIWIKLRTVGNKTFHLLCGYKWELNYTTQHKTLI